MYISGKPAVVYADTVSLIQSAVLPAVPGVYLPFVCEFLQLSVCVSGVWRLFGELFCCCFQGQTLPPTSRFDSEAARLQHPPRLCLRRRRSASLLCTPGQLVNAN